jgi:hypothetical protein
MVGQNKPPKWAERSCQTHGGSVYEINTNFQQANIAPACVSSDDARARWLVDQHDRSDIQQ